jgi:hypothetical protein
MQFVLADSVLSNQGVYVWCIDNSQVLTEANLLLCFCCTSPQLPSVELRICDGYGHGGSHVIVFTFAKLAYDLEQLPPFSFRRASVLHSLIMPCFAK